MGKLGKSLKYRNGIYDITYKCDLLIDQGRKIGDDPIGYKCSQDAAYELGGYLVCEECKNIVMENPERLTYPPVECSGKDYQNAIISRTIKGLTGFNS